MLRVFSPTKLSAKSNSNNSMLLEKNLGQPILQVDCGKFSSSADICVAILHSRKLIVANIINKQEFLEYEVIHQH